MFYMYIYAIYVYTYGIMYIFHCMYVCATSKELLFLCLSCCWAGISCCLCYFLCSKYCLLFYIQSFVVERSLFLLLTSLTCCVSMRCIEKQLDTNM